VVCPDRSECRFRDGPIIGAGGGSSPKRVMKMWLVVTDSGIEVAVGEDSEHYSDSRWSHYC
jgi:hypothetical protein